MGGIIGVTRRTQRRFVDHPGLDIVRMGVRAYDPHIGRFLSQDPIVGGSANDYDYVNADPINNLDLGGTRCAFGVKARHRVRSSGRNGHRPTWKTVETCNGAREVGRNVRRGAAPVANAALRYAPTVGRLGIALDGCIGGGALAGAVGAPLVAASAGAASGVEVALIGLGCAGGIIVADKAFGVSPWHW